MARPAITVEVSSSEREQLAAISRSQLIPQSLARRARIVLMAADGISGAEIAARCAVTRPVVTYWKKRFLDHGVAGLHDRAKTGRRRTLDDEAVAELLKSVMNERPPYLEHWSVRATAKKLGISRSAVERYFALSGVQLHRAKGFRVSGDTLFFARVRDVVGLYLSLSFNAFVLCVDKECPGEATWNIRQLLSTGIGYVEGVTHYCVSQDTTTLLEAINAATSEVVVESEPRHSCREFIGFLNQIDCAMPENLDVHLIVDSEEVRGHAEVSAWLAKRARYYVHFTQTYPQWLKQLESWFGLVTQQAINRGLFETVRQLISGTKRYVDKCSLHGRSFIWAATAESVLEKIKRLRK